MKDHEIRELVNQLRDVAIKYHGTGQLREQIARTVRAAILQAHSDDDGEPTDDERIMAIEGIHSCERCGDEGWVVGEMGITRCACGRAGNSPVIPDGWKIAPIDATRAMIDAAASVEEDGYDAMHKAMLAAAPQPQNAQQNIPEIIPGWIPVSERMPEDEQEVLTINRMGHRFVSFFDKHSGLFFDRLDAPAACCIEHVLVTHWMPLPAGPKEVK